MGAEVAEPVVRTDIFMHDDDPRRFPALVQRTARRMVDADNAFWERCGESLTALSVWQTNPDREYLAYFGLDRVSYQPHRLPRSVQLDEANVILRLAYAQEGVLRKAWPWLKHHVPEPNDGFSASEDKIWSGCYGLLFRSDQVRTTLVKGEDKLVVISDEMLNPLMAYFVEKSLECWPGSGFGEYQNELIAEMAYLFGYLDDSNPRSVIYKARLAETIGEDSPTVLRQLKNRETIGELDSPQLTRLKGFWGEVFVDHWVALAESEDKSARPVEGSELLEARRRMPKVPIESMALAEARALRQVRIDKTRTNLTGQLLGVVEAYSGKRPELSQMRELFRHEVANQIVKIVAGGYGDKTLPLLLRVVDPRHNRLERVFGDNFYSLDPLEQVTLLAYSAFVANGTMVKGLEGMTHVLQQQILPKLKQHHDVGLGEKQLMEQKQLVTFDLERHARIANRARARLSRLDQKAELVSPRRSEVAKLVETRREEFRQLAKLTREEYEKIEPTLPLDPPKSPQEREMHLALKWLEPAMNWGIVYMLALHGTAPEGAPPLFLAMGGLLGYMSAAFQVMRHQESFRDWVGQWKYRVGLFELDMPDQAKVIPWERKRMQIRLLSRLMLIGGMAISGAVASDSLGKGMQVARDWVRAKAEQLVGNRGAERTEVSKVEAPKSEVLNPGIGNDPGLAGLSHEPRFVVYENPSKTPTSYVWIDQSCEASSSGVGFDCSLGENIQSQIWGAVRLDDPQKLKDFIDQMEANGYKVRFNLGLAGHFQIPEGFEPMSLVGYKVKVESASFNPLAGMEVNWDVASGGVDSMLGVVYRPLNGGEGYNEAYLPPEGPPILTPADFDRPEMAKDKPIYDWVVEQRAIYGPERLSNMEILAGIKERISNLGMDYGFAKYDATGVKNHEEQLARLFSFNPDGSMVNTQLICNQFAYADYLIAQAAGLPVRLVTGYVQDGNNRYGGQDAKAHMVVVVLDENGQWKLFDATLPDRDNPTYVTVGDPGSDIVEKLLEADRLKRDLELAVGAIAVTAVAAAAVRSDKLVKSVQKWQDQRTQALEQGTAVGGVLAYWSLRNLADLYDVPETTASLGSSREYARQLASDVFTRLVDEDKPDQLWEVQMQARLAEDVKELRNRQVENLEWLGGEGTPGRVEEGGRVFLQELTKIERQKRGQLTPVQKMSLANIKKIVGLTTKLLRKQS